MSNDSGQWIGDAWLLKETRRGKGGGGVLANWVEPYKGGLLACSRPRTLHPYTSQSSSFLSNMHIYKYNVVVLVLQYFWPDMSCRELVENVRNFREN